MEAVVRITNLEPIFWRDDTMAPLLVTHGQLIQKVLTLPDLQCAWMVLLCCSAVRANRTLRVVHPGQTAGWDFASLLVSLDGFGAPKCHTYVLTRSFVELGRLHGTKTPSPTQHHLPQSIDRAGPIPCAMGEWQTNRDHLQPAGVNVVQR